VIRRRLLTVAGALCIVVGLVIGHPGTSSAQVSPGAGQQHPASIAGRSTTAEYLVRFINLKSQKCLGVESASLANGAQVLQWTCAGQLDQYWRVRYVGGLLAEVVNYNSGRCLAVQSASLVNGGNILQWTCNNNLDQRWDVVGWESYGWVVNGNSARCLSVESGSMVNGARALQWTCGSQSDQLWYVDVIA
jgi:hypothetical protein